MVDQVIAPTPGAADERCAESGRSFRPYAWRRNGATDPHVRLCLMRGIEVWIGNKELALSNRKAKAMLAYLALTPGMKETRDRLVGLLWSESEDGNARASLRQLLYALRSSFHAAGLSGLSTDHASVGLDPALYKTDLDDLLTRIGRGDPTDLHLGEDIAASFLRGYDDIDPAFTEWLTLKRESVRRGLIGQLEDLLAETSGRPEATKQVARALVEVDRSHEIACQRLMEAYADLGSPASALAAYKQLWGYLEAEYDIEPSPATQALAVAIRCGQYRSAQCGARARSSHVPLVTTARSVISRRMSLGSRSCG